MKYLTTLCLLLMLAGCSLVPTLERSSTLIPANYVATTIENGNGADLGWRQMFTDTYLQRLIEMSLSHNRDLRIAALNIDAVRAQFGIARASQLPSVSAIGGMTHQRVSGDNGVNAQGQKNIGVSLNAFEIDLFGRVQAQSEAAFARYLASEQGRRATQISLVAAVADTYFAELLARQQLQLTENTLADWRASLEITLLLKDAQQSSGLDITQIEGQVATAEADLESRRRELAQARNALELLVGATLPEQIAEPVPLEYQEILTDLPAGLPSDLLIRRPDILQAEQNLRSANADVGVARAAFLPQISLTASLGLASSSIASLFEGAQKTWSFSPQITQPLFQGGRLGAELSVAEIRKSVAIAEYERTIQVAFREVADGLAGRATYGHQIKAQMKAVASADRSRELSKLRYFAGQDSRLQLLEAQRAAYAKKQVLIELRRERIRSTISLYKALGGGFNELNSQLSSIDKRH